MIAFAVFVTDRITKGLVEANVANGTEVNAVPGLLWITNAHNSGAAFGILPAAALIFLVASAIVSGVLIYYVFTHRDSLYRDAILGLILGGTLGNGYDRLFHGTVTDFLAVHFWPVFNVADASISVGVAGLVLGYVLRRSRSG